jgi:predicted amidohydrolase YtcJ
MRPELKTCTLGAALVLASVALGHAQELLLTNGRIVTLDAASTVARALAIRQDTIVAVGDEEAVRRSVGADARIIDLGGRTVIPGLIDSHIHAVRTGLTYTVETDWSDVTTLAQGIERLAQAAKARPGAWILVGGGWHEAQLAEKRGPTPEELAKVAPDSPVYVQHLYDYAVISPTGMAKLGLDDDAKVPPAGKLERGADGKPTGVVRGDLLTFARLFARVSEVGFDGQVAGIRAFFQTLARVGVTGIVDAAGGGMLPHHYYPLYRVWRDGDLPVRVALYFNSQNPGQELADLQRFFQVLPGHFGDDRLRIIGVGELIVWGMHDGTAGRVKVFTPREGAAAATRQVAEWAAERRLGFQIHASSDSSASQILGIFEEVNAKVPIKNLRWAIAHIENASADTLARMQKLGVVWAVQDRLYFEGEVWPRLMGAEAAKRAPPIAEGLKAGVVVAGGTDGPRSAPYNPFVTLQWLVSGRNVTGNAYRAPDQSPSREQALRIHTVNSAYMAGDDHRRGTLEPGKWADLLVLSEDYFAVPEDAIAGIRPLLTLVGGKVVHAEGPFAALAGAAPGR